MQSVLEELNRTPGLLGSLIVADDGLVIARHVAYGVDCDAVGASISLLARSVDTLAQRCGRGAVRAITFEADSRRLFAVRLPIGALVAIAEESASVGLVRVAMKKAVAAIGQQVPGTQRDASEGAPVCAESG
jgi:predicted regulator of Ras-like GTPase activity (Roadblock/LC7/MglB family)